MKRISLYLNLIAASLVLSGFITAKAQINYSEKNRLTDNWEFLREDIGNIWEAVRPAAKGSPETLPLWTKVTLPHCFNAEDAVAPDVNYYQGPGWYRTYLTVNNPYPDGRILLYFEGAGQKTDVYVYTQKVGSHVGGYDEWTVDITDAVNKFRSMEDAKRFDGKVPLTIRCDNSRDTEMIPSDLSDFNVYGGLYRYVNLVYLPALYLTNIFMDASVDSKGKEGNLSVKAAVNNQKNMSEGQLQIKVFSPDGKMIKNETRQFSPLDGNDLYDALSMKIAKPLLWSPETPNLYRCELTLTSSAGTMTCSDVFGFRNFEFMEKGPFLLNGKRLLLRGTHRHEDHAGVAAAMTEDMIIHELQMMKDMGVNFIRLGHYQQSRIVLEQCDRLGILVWEEIPWCRGGLGGTAYQEQAKRMLKNMITQHRNHPAIILWGLGNENDWSNDFPEFDQEKIRAFAAQLNDLAHQLDNTRKTCMRRCDFCKDIVDVYSPSIWAGWYRGIYTDYKDVTYNEMQQVKHFFHAEWGGDSHARRYAENSYEGLDKIQGGDSADERAGDATLYGGIARASKDGDWSESYICDLIDWHLKEQKTMPWLTGAAYWIFKDFSTPIRPENPVPYVNQKGVVERDFTPKEAYYVFQSYWTEKPMIHIFGHTWQTRWGKPDEKKVMKVYSNCEEVELFLNGVSLGKKKRDSQNFPATGLRWESALLEGKNTLKAIGKKGKEQVTDETDFTYETRPFGKEAQIKVRIIESTPEYAWIEAEFQDEKGVVCLNSREYFRFESAGDGILVVNQGTSTGSKLVQAYNGRARIKMLKNGGETIVAVKSEGLKTTFITVASYNPSKAGRMEETRTVLRDLILQNAESALLEAPETVTTTACERSAGGIHDFYSEGDYWWPDPKNPDGPYIRRDGETNPENFVAHRLAMIRFSRIVGTLASAYLITGDEKYVEQAFKHIHSWFVDASTRMNPDLQYAQAIHGVSTGRGTGIIDTIHLMEVAQSIIRMQNADCVDKTELQAIKEWFAEYLRWLTTHPYGIEEMNAENNHGTCWAMQVASFAKLTGNEELLQWCRNRYKEVLLPAQMAEDGSFPREIARTKPYGYSLFNLDAMVTLCQILSCPEDDLYDYTTANGLNIKKAVDFMFPYIQDKSAWAFQHDVMYWNDLPVAQPALLFAAIHYNEPAYFDLWKSLNHAPTVPEVERNLPVRNPLIWME